MKEKLSKYYKISKNKIILTLPQKGSINVQIIVQINKFNEFSELKNVKVIYNSDVIMSPCKLRINHLDPRENKVDEWGIKEKGGNKSYFLWCILKFLLIYIIHTFLIYFQPHFNICSPQQITKIDKEISIHN